MGCMDQNALNFNPHATVNTQCCYPPNRYVKVDMAESVFRENFWTMEVGGKMAGVGLPLILGRGLRAAGLVRQGDHVRRVVRRHEGWRWRRDRLVARRH